MVHPQATLSSTQLFPFKGHHNNKKNIETSTTKLTVQSLCINLTTSRVHKQQSSNKHHTQAPIEVWSQDTYIEVGPPSKFVLLTPCVEGKLWLRVLGQLLSQFPLLRQHQRIVSGF